LTSSSTNQGLAEAIAGVTVTPPPPEPPAETVSEMVTLAIAEPAMPVTVTVALAAGAVLAAVRVSVAVLPLPVAVVGLNDAVTPLGSPLAVNVGRPVNPVWVVAPMVLVALDPGLTVRLVGLAKIAKSETKPATVREMPSECVMPPPVPVTVIVVTPLATELDADSRRTVVLADGAGVSVAVTPAGSPLTLRATPAVNPPLGVTVICVVEDCVAPTETLGGLAESAKSGPAASAAREASPVPPRTIATTSRGSSLIRSMSDLLPRVSDEIALPRFYGSDRR
jgi:hypothetical protein